MKSCVAACAMCVVAGCMFSVECGGCAHAGCLHITDVCLLIMVYQGVQMHASVCRLSVVGNLILLLQPRCAAWCYET